MTWQNPLAFAGLVALVFPILIHLLSRTHATLQRFPTLRFLDVSRLLPTRSPRITDVLLLVLRAGAIAFAVLALADPLLSTADRMRVASSKVARAIIVDRAASQTGDKQVADTLSAHVRQLASEASASTVIQSANVTRDLTGAESWLRTQSGRSEIIVVSDFNTSSIDSTSLAAVPKEFGLKLVRSSPAVASADSSAGTFTTQNATVRIGAEPARTVGEWATSDPYAHAPGLSLHVSASDMDAAAAVRSVVSQIIGALRADSTRAIAIVYPGATDYESLAAAAKPLNQSWMAAFISTLRTNEHLHMALAASELTSDTNFANAFTSFARNRGNVTVASATEIAIDGHDVLALFVRAKPTSATSAELIAAVEQTQGVPWAVNALEPNHLRDAVLSSLQRDSSVPASNAATAREYGSTGESDARWFWLVALVLLAAEGFVRFRQERSSPGIEGAS